jgi:hypothetical protein
MINQRRERSGTNERVLKHLHFDASMPMYDFINVAHFTGEKDHEKVLYPKKEKFTAERQSFEILVDQKPTRAGIDAQNQLICPENKKTDQGTLLRPCQQRPDRGRVDDHFGGSCGVLFGQTPAMLSPAAAARVRIITAGRIWLGFLPPHGYSADQRWRDAAVGCIDRWRLDCLRQR